MVARREGTERRVPADAGRRDSDQDGWSPDERALKGLGGGEHHGGVRQDGWSPDERALKETAWSSAARRALSRRMVARREGTERRYHTRLRRTGRRKTDG